MSGQPAAASAFSPTRCGVRQMAAPRQYVQPLRRRLDSPPSPEIPNLLHRLNNQLGVILVNAELLEAKATDQGIQARAVEVVRAVLGALETSTEIKNRFADQNL